MSQSNAGYRLSDGPVLKEYVILGADCRDFPAGLSIEGYVRTPCCDTLPVDSPECVLSLDLIGPLPEWVQ